MSNPRDWDVQVILSVCINGAHVNVLKDWMLESSIIVRPPDSVSAGDSFSFRVQNSRILTLISSWSPIISYTPRTEEDLIDGAIRSTTKGRHKGSYLFYWERREIGGKLFRAPSPWKPVFPPLQIKVKGHHIRVLRGRVGGGKRYRDGGTLTRAGQI